MLPSDPVTVTWVARFSWVQRRGVHYVNKGVVYVNSHGGYTF